jgi:Outer membrane lipoprotein-sorting protein
MIRLLFILLAVMSSWPLLGQTKLTAEQQKQIIEKIDQTASAMKGMQCDFVQTKRMKLLSKEMQSKGIMYFKRPNKLRWQYIAPYDYTFILNDDKVQIKSSKSTKNIDVQGNKMFRQITNIILNSVTGGSLKSSSDFNVEVYKKDNTYFAKLFPKKKELKQLYQVIEIYFDSALTMVNSVRMVEKTGDETRVNLINTKLNIVVDDKMFAVN